MKKILILVALTYMMLACDPTAEVTTQPPVATRSQPDSATPTEPAETKDPEPSVSKAGRQPAAIEKWDLWLDGPRLRGVDIHPCSLFTVDGCAQPTTRQDLQDLRDLGANLINASYPGVFSEEPPYEVDPVALEYLDNLIAWAQEVELYVVIHFRTGPGRNEGAIVLEGEPLYNVWYDQAAHDAWVEMWRFTAERYRDVPVVAGYNLMVEPNSNTLIDTNSEMAPVEVQALMAGTLMDWNAFAAEITTAIRQVDPETPIIVNSLNWASAEWFAALEPTGDARTVYSLHAYDPDVYILQEEGETTYHYPDVVDDYGETITFDRAWLEENYRPVRQFAREHKAPIYVGEFGLLRWVPDADAFLHDQTELFEEYGWNYAVYVWRGDEADFDGFNLEYGPDPGNHAPAPENPLLNVFLDRWARNTDFPGESAPLGDDIPLLSAVRQWLYLIDVNLEPETVEQIIDSDYDMVVLDFIPSEENNTDYPIAEVVARLHKADQPKRVIAYIDIGQAEEYRTYWAPGWGVGDPEWIVASDPDGWQGNYPVAYWYDEYQEIWLGPDGYLQAILDAGFDGVYLDWVEAYSDKDVVALAERDGVDPVEEMVWWVNDIAEFARAQRPGFSVIGQNAAELAVFDDYVNAIDAIAQEQVWFDGGADNDPPGACPLPRTDADVDSVAYRDSLSDACRRQDQEYPESTRHVSSEEYLGDLQRAQDRGVIVFTVDYALDPDNVVWVHQTSRGLGFIPFVGNRALDQFVEPAP